VPALQVLTVLKSSQLHGAGATRQSLTAPTRAAVPADLSPRTAPTAPTVASALTQFPSLELETLTAGWQGEVRYLKVAL